MQQRLQLAVVGVWEIELPTVHALGLDAHDVVCACSLALDEEASEVHLPRVFPNVALPTPAAPVVDK